jgi:hypothetical protein
MGRVTDRSPSSNNPPDPDPGMAPTAFACPCFAGELWERDARRSAGPN